MLARSGFAVSTLTATKVSTICPSHLSIPAAIIVGHGSAALNLIAALLYFDRFPGKRCVARLRLAAWQRASIYPGSPWRRARGKAVAPPSLPRPFMKRQAGQSALPQPRGIGAGWERGCWVAAGSRQPPACRTPGQPERCWWAAGRRAPVVNCSASRAPTRRPSAACQAFEPQARMPLMRREPHARFRDGIEAAVRRGGAWPLGPLGGRCGRFVDLVREWTGGAEGPSGGGRGRSACRADRLRGPAGPPAGNLSRPSDAQGGSGACLAEGPTIRVRKATLGPSREKA
jgi:hypothetical protein